MKHESSWRTHARKVIRRVLAENAGKSEKEIRKAISDAYPFGERKCHPPADPNQGVLL